MSSDSLTGVCVCVGGVCFQFVWQVKKDNGRKGRRRKGVTGDFD